MKGEVVWFNDSKGFGFIRPDSGDKDIFVHFSAIRMEGYKSLKQGDKVVYEVARNEKGPIAIEVSILEE